MNCEETLGILANKIEEINYHQNLALSPQQSSKEFCFDIDAILFLSRSLIECIFCFKTEISDYFELVGKSRRQFDNSKQRTINRLMWLIEFRSRLNETISHAKLTGESVLACFVNLIDEYSMLIDYIKKEFGFVLLDRFALLASKAFPEDQIRYFEWVFKAKENLDKNQKCNEFYYVLSRRPIFFDGKKIYEYSLAHESNVSNKINSILAYSSKKINQYYRLDIEIVPGYYNFQGTNVRFNFIKSANVKILNYSLQLIAEIINSDVSFKTRFYESQSYRYLMSYFSEYDTCIIPILSFSDKQIVSFLNNLSGKTGELDQFGIFLYQLWRYLNTKENPWKNVVRYLACSFNKDIIEKCLFTDDSLHRCVSTGCLLFEQFPFLACPPKHRTVSLYLESAFGSPEIGIKIFKYVEKESKDEGNIFVDVENLIERFEIDRDELESILENFNNYCGDDHPQWHLSLDKSKKYIYIKNIYENEIKIFKILTKSKTLQVEKTINFAEPALNNLSTFKQDFLSNKFKLGNNYVIFGPAGSGKTTLLSAMIKGAVDSGLNVICLAPTKSSLSALRGKHHSTNKVLYKTLDAAFNDSTCTNADILIIDECGFISDRKILRLLAHVKFETGIFAGDYGQIEAPIEYGNWFFNLNQIFEKNGYLFDLSSDTSSGYGTQFRTTVPNLYKAWTDTRKAFSKEDFDSAFSKLISYNCLHEIKDFLHSRHDVLLSLGYEGFYGINNINSILQSLNSAVPYSAGAFVYKAGDPIVFTQSYKEIYNGSKGVIKNVYRDFNGRLIIEFEIYSETGPIEDKYIIRRKFNSEVLGLPPFAVSYSMSFHKAQGLEFNDVGIIIPDSFTNRIDKRLFYSAITRARERLTIYINFNRIDTLKQQLANSATVSKKDFNIAFNKFVTVK